jgi:hypothetical protein
MIQLSNEIQHTIAMYIATLFTITILRNQPICPQMDEWIKQKWYTYPI